MPFTTPLGIFFPAASDPHPSQAWHQKQAATTQTAILEAVAGASADQGPIPAETDLDTIVTPGVYSIESSAVAATLVNSPGAAGAAVLIVNATDNKNVSQQYVTVGNAATIFLRGTVSVTSGTWSTWRDLRSTPATQVPNGTDLNMLRTPGLYTVPTTGVATSLLNAPDGLPAILEVFEVSAVLTVQRWTSTLSSGGMHFRATTSTSTGNFTPWRSVYTGTPEASSDTGLYRHLDLVSRARMRRGGRIGTGGKAAVALRFDHHLDSFQAKVLPLLQQHNLPWAQAINPERLGAGDDNMTWAQLQTMCLQHGGEVWNHGGNHGDASTETALREQIVTSLGTLQTNLPALAIEGWCPPGLAAPAYMGAAPFKTVEQNSGTLAGRLITGHHAMVAGYAPGQYRSLDPSIQPIGASHVTIDDAAPSSLTSVLNTVVAGCHGVAFMLHPNYLDEPGYLTTAQLATFLASIAARRDAGDLVVLSYSGLWFADEDSTRRDDVAPPAQASASVAGGVAHTVQVAAFRQDHLLGAPREVAVAVTAAAATTLTISVDGGPATTHAVPAGASIVRRVVTLPANAAASIPVVVTPAAAVTIARVSVLSI
jgi:hypothetical protein